MEFEEIGTLLVGWVTLDAKGEGRPSMGPEDILVTAMTIEDTVTTQTRGAKDATQMVVIDGTDVTDVTYVRRMEVVADWVETNGPEVGTILRDHTKL